jgi:hypothetical protein
MIRGEQVAVSYPFIGSNALRVHHEEHHFVVRLGAHKARVTEREAEELAYQILARCR